MQRSGGRMGQQRRAAVMRRTDGSSIISADISAYISADIAPLAESTEQLVHDLTVTAGVRQRRKGLEDARRLRDLAEISPRYRRDEYRRRAQISA